MPLPLIAVAIAGAIGNVVTASAAAEVVRQAPEAVLVQAGDRDRLGRSYVEPRTVPGLDPGPQLTTPGYQPRAAPRQRSRPGSNSGAGPTASDCAAGYGSRSRWTRREFNRMCGQGS